MLFSLPNLLLIDVLALIEPVDRLALAMSCRLGNSIVSQDFEDKKLYGKAWAIGQCLRKMYRAVRDSGDVKIS